MIAGQSECPARAALRRGTAGRGDQMGFGPAIHLCCRRLAVRRPAMYGNLQPVFGRRAAGPLHSTDTDLEGPAMSSSFKAPARMVLIGGQKDLGPLALGGDRFARGHEGFEFNPFGFRQVDAIFLWHRRCSPGPPSFPVRDTHQFDLNDPLDEAGAPDVSGHDPTGPRAADAPPRGDPRPTVRGSIEPGMNQCGEFCQTNPFFGLLARTFAALAQNAGSPLISTSGFWPPHVICCPPPASCSAVQADGAHSRPGPLRRSACAA